MLSGPAEAEVSDGRRVRGDASRRAILDAAGRVISDDGVVSIAKARAELGFDPHFRLA